MSEKKNLVKSFFGVAIRGRTYLTVLYLLLAFPLGILYFVFLTTGISLGVGLLITWLGFLVLLLMMMTWFVFSAFEHRMTGWMLGVKMYPMVKEKTKEKNLWKKFKSHISNPVTWKSLAYLFVKFPLGIISFVVAVTLLTLSLTMLSAPFIYNRYYLDFYYFTVDTFGAALLVCVGGVLVTLISMHVMNGLGFVSGQFAKVMLGTRKKESEPESEEEGIEEKK
jgi:hypothetical protein